MTRLVAVLVLAAVVGCGGDGGSADGGGRGGSGVISGSGGGGGSAGGGSAGGVDGGGSGGVDLGTGPIPIAQYETLALAAGCNNLVKCGLYPDQATCLSSDQVVPHLYDTLVADVASGKVLYDPAQGRACVDATNTLPCTRTALAATNPALASCDAVFNGTVAAGGACFFDEECAGGGNCQIDYTSCPSGECCPGSCVGPPPTVGLGVDCTAYGTVTCAAGTTCTPRRPSPLVGLASRRRRRSPARIPSIATRRAEPARRPRPPAGPATRRRVRSIATPKRIDATPPRRSAGRCSGRGAPATPRRARASPMLLATRRPAPAFRSRLSARPAIRKAPFARAASAIRPA